MHQNEGQPARLQRSGFTISQSKNVATLQCTPCAELRRVFLAGLVRDNVLSRSAFVWHKKMTRWSSETLFSNFAYEGVRSFLFLMLGDSSVSFVACYRRLCRRARRQCHHRGQIASSCRPGRGGSCRRRRRHGRWSFPRQPRRSERGRGPERHFRQRVAVRHRAGLRLYSRRATVAHLGGAPFCQKCMNEPTPPPSLVVL